MDRRTLLQTYLKAVICKIKFYTGNLDKCEGKKLQGSKQFKIIYQ